MNKNMKKWISALRSGKYHQATDALTDGTGKFCCLGVACQLAAKEGICKKNGEFYDGEANLLPPKVARWLGLSERRINPSVRVKGFGKISLVELNDDHHYTFRQIADLIEEQLA